MATGYHDLEPIVGLDGIVWDIFGLNTGKKPEAEAEVLENARQNMTAALPVRNPCRGVFVCGMECPWLLALGKRLHDANIAVPPLNAETRGGTRAIFQSHALGLVLTELINTTFAHFIPRRFSHVNPVFRYNEFVPGDADFASHFDTPYFDAEKRQRSRFTLLVYLSGTALPWAPLLTFEDPEVSLPAPDAAQVPYVVVMDQRLRHAGHPYPDGLKAFLRTELVFNIGQEELDTDPTVAALFSRAVYATKESVTFAGSAAVADSLYTAATERRYNIRMSSFTDVLFVKPTRRLVTDGHQYWVAGSDVLDCLFRCLHDYFVVPEADLPVVKFSADVCPDDDAVRKVLEDMCSEYPVASSSFLSSPPTISRTIELPLITAEEYEDDSDGSDWSAPCCPYHASGDWDADCDEHVVDCANALLQSTNDTLKTYSAVVFGKELRVSAENVILHPDGRISFRIPGDECWPRVNFAACWNGEPPRAYVGVDTSVGRGYRLPDIWSRPCWGKDGFYFTVDAFRNSWCLRKQQISVVRHAAPQSDESDASFKWTCPICGDTQYMSFDEAFDPRGCAECRAPSDERDNCYDERKAFLSFLCAVARNGRHLAVPSPWRHMAVFNELLQLRSESAGHVVRFLFRKPESSHKRKMF